MANEFKGDRKEGNWLLARAEDRLKAWLLPKVPTWLETHHLTMSTVLWGAAVVGFSALARQDLRWLWGASLAIVLQYVTDLLDGAVGRARDTGLVRWGYSMDHLLDYAFLCCIVVGWSLVLPGGWVFAVALGLMGAFMVNSFLSFSATDEFRISFLGIGPTEGRLAFILANAAIIVLGPARAGAAVPWLLAAAAVAFAVSVYRTQARIWALDMRIKAERAREVDAA